MLLVLGRLHKKAAGEYFGSWSDIGGEHPQNHQFHQFGSVLEVGEHMIKFISYILVKISMIAWNKIIALS